MVWSLWGEGKWLWFLVPPSSGAFSGSVQRLTSHPKHAGARWTRTVAYGVPALRIYQELPLLPVCLSPGRQGASSSHSCHDLHAGTTVKVLMVPACSHASWSLSPGLLLPHPTQTPWRPATITHTPPSCGLGNCHYEGWKECVLGWFAMLDFEALFW